MCPGLNLLAGPLLVMLKNCKHFIPVITDGSRISFKCDEDLLRSRKGLLRKYIGGDSKLGLQALYALQSLFVALDHPPGR